MLVSPEGCPVAAGLKRGISTSGGGPIGVSVSSVSASTMALGVW